MSTSPNPIIFAALGAVALLGGAGWSYTRYSANSAQKARIAALRIEVRDEKEVRNKLEELQSQAAETEEKLRHLELSVSQREYIPTLLTELEATGKQHGIDVLGVRPLPRQAQTATPKDGKAPKGASRKAYEELDIEVTGSGTYGDVMRFVDALTQFPKIAEVRQLSLTPDRDPRINASPKLQATIQIRAYVFPAVKPAEDKLAESPKGLHNDG